MAAELTDANFENEVVKSTIPVLIDLWAPWCGPCRMMSPVIDKLADEYKGKAKILKLNTDENPNTAMQFHIQSIPTLLFFKSGEMVEQLIGVQPEKEIRRRLDNLIK